MKAQDRIGAWLLIRPLGDEGGATWEVEGPHSHRAALKRLPEVGEDIRALGTICHPSVVDLVDVGPDYVVVGLVPGITLRQRLRNGRFSEAFVLQLGALLADALAVCHAAGVVHGDVKPENIVLDGERPVLVDFGGTRTQGGTLRYAAPERLIGRTVPAGDVYALGVTLRELLEGGLPMDELGVGVALDTPPSTGPDWFRGLLAQMCNPSHRARPQAADVADAFAVNGMPAPPPTPNQLRRRAQRSQVRRGEVDRRVLQWTRRGGQLHLVGPTGSGKSRTLRRAATELQADDKPWAFLQPTPEPWMAIDQLLRELGLALPDRGGDRALATAHRLAGVGGLHLLVDDVGQLEPETLEVIKALVRGPVHLLVTGQPTGQVLGLETVSLGPLSYDGVRELTERVLGRTGPIGAFTRAVATTSGGWPGPAVDILVQAVGDGLVRRHAGAWHQAQLAYDQLAVPDRDPVAGVSAAARRLGQALALFALPMHRGFVDRLMGVDSQRAVDDLCDAGLANRLGASLRLASSARSALVPQDQGPVHQALVRAWPRPYRPVDRFAWHCLCAGDALRAVECARAGVSATLHRDAASAAALAEGLVDLAEVPGLRALQVQALAAAGRIEQARAITADNDDDPEVAIALATQLIRLERYGEETDGLLQRAEELGAAPGDLAELRLRSHYAAGRLTDAVELATEIAGGPAPEDEGDSLDRWLRARSLWAEIQGASAPEEGLAVLSAVPPRAGRGRLDRARLEGVRARLLFLAGRLKDAIRAAEDAAHERNGLPPLERARLMNTLAVFHHEGADRRAALACWEQALLLFEQLGAAIDSVRVLVNLCVGYREAGRYERALTTGNRAVEEASRLNQDALACAAIGNLGDLHVARDDLVAASTCYRNAFAMAQALNLDAEQVELQRRQAVVAVRRHRPKALQLARMAGDAAERIDAQDEVARCLALQAVCWARRGDRERVAAMLGAAIEPAKEAGSAGLLAELRLWAAQAWLALGELDKAREDADWTVFYAREVHHRQLQQEAEEVLASASAARSATTDAGALQRLLSLSVVVEHATDLESVLEAVADTAMELLRVDRSFVLLKGRKGLKVVASAHRDGADETPPSMSIVRRAMSQGGREVIAADLDERQLLKSQSVEELRIGSAMCVPLVHLGDVLGAIYVDSVRRTGGEIHDSAWLLRSLASTAASAVANIRRIETSQKQQQQARELVHDIRGCLTTVLLVAEELRGSISLQPDEREAVEALDMTADRIVGMVDAFMRQSAPARQEVDLAALSESMVAAMTPQARSQGVKLTLTADPAVIIGVREELGRVLLNLIGNCLKYSPGGSVVRVSLRTEPEFAVWRVVDEGPGLSTGQLVNLFESGVQGTDALPGFGLGLGIVKRIVTEHNGTVTARNNADTGGAVFEVWLPVDRHPG